MCVSGDPVSMQTGSHIHDLVDCLKVVRAARVNDGSSAEQEALHDVEVRLCELIQKMLNGSLTGQMFAPLPHELMSASDINRSLVDQTTV